MNQIWRQGSELCSRNRPSGNKNVGSKRPPRWPPTDITLRSRAALRVMSATDVRQHTTLVDFRVICPHRTAASRQISSFWDFWNWPFLNRIIDVWIQSIWNDCELFIFMNYWWWKSIFSRSTRRILHEADFPYQILRLKPIAGRRALHTICIICLSSQEN